MDFATRAAGRLGVLALSLAGAACFVEIDHCKDPSDAFRQARSEAARYQGRPGPAHRLNVLVFDPGDHELVRVSLPMWLVRKLHDKVDWDDAEVDSDRADRDA